MQFHIANAAAQPRALTENLTPFVRADLSLDVAAIKAAAKERFALKQDFINRYTGEPRRYWQRNIARRILGLVRREATDQRHAFVWSQMPADLPFTPDEQRRRVLLQSRMRCASITARGNAEFRQAAAEFRAIGHAAEHRAYVAILEASGRAC